jgi:hypothetical protein
VLFLLYGCGPNRKAALSKAAQEQATIATGSIGTKDQIRAQARDGAHLLKEISAALVRNPPKGNQQAVQLFTTDAAEVSAGLDAIADSQTDDQFTASVFNMCDAQRRAAAPMVGHFLVGVANGIRAKPPGNVPPQQVEQQANYFSTFGERMINVPTQCDRAQAGMAEASAQEQQAEISHSKNVNNAMTAAAVVFAGTVLFASAVGSAAATRPPVTEQYNTNNYY